MIILSIYLIYIVPLGTGWMNIRVKTYKVTNELCMFLVYKIMYHTGIKVRLFFKIHFFSNT